MRGIQASIPTRRRIGSLVCALAIGGFVACGGTAVVDGPSGNQAGASSGAGASSSADEACSAAAVPGQCNAYIPSFWHDPKTGLCEPFVYGGCGGNANRYPSRDACLQACPGQSNGWDACVDDSNCVLVSPSCCGECEPVASERLVALNLAQLQPYLDSRCAGDARLCVPCKAATEDEQTKKYFKPVCRNARCTLLDVRESPLTACQKTSDCTLRDGAECCAECDGSGWVPVNKSAHLCGDVPTACDDCASPLPSNWRAVCLSGSCQLEGLL